MNEFPDFDGFFRALWGYGPFPWQRMLAERVVEQHWPLTLDLPTAAGKTACIDIALYALAAQANQTLADRTAPRRIWFVVDRRIVVDEAFERAKKIADKLKMAAEGTLKSVADRLREIAGTGHPMAVGRLRGGILRDDGWVRVPSQPAVITTTVDQVGSRLLFRPYGPGRLSAPIHAGLVANDSLIILDEAHCSVPFHQTLRSIQAFRGPAWAEAQLATPFAFVAMTATHSPDVPQQETFPGPERDQALDHPLLKRRLRTSKLAELVELKGGTDLSAGLLVNAVARHVAGYLDDGRTRVGVMVNRVAVAGQITEMLTSKFGDQADVVMLTGRMRPLERDSVIRLWELFLRAAFPSEPLRPIIVVATQTLEVGADFSFDALITEIASLDAIRQRFGRLARMGADHPVAATILARDRDVREGAKDPIYGNALSATWDLLTDWSRSAVVAGRDARVVDVGFHHLDNLLAGITDLSPYLVQADEAPVLLPAHLDLLCQTAPIPHPDPDVSLYLHGKQGSEPDVQVVWRSDLTPDSVDNWVETVSICRPLSAEMLTVPLNRIRSWLARPGTPDMSSDIEGVAPDPDDPGDSIRPCLLWRGRDRSRVVRAASKIGPGDVVVLPASYGMKGVGQSVPDRALGDDMLDLWEPACAEQARVAVRLHHGVLWPWLSCPPVGDLVAMAEAPVLDREAIQDGIAAVLDYSPEGEDEPATPPDWWRELLRRSRHGRIEQHPGGGVILFARPAAAVSRSAEYDLFADEDELSSYGGRQVALSEHSEHVCMTAGKLAESCLPPEFHEPVRRAGYLHDLGKMDRRFQVLLRCGDELAVTKQDEPIAKSQFAPLSPARRNAIREACGIPSGFRHEMLSLQILQHDESLIGDTDARDLVLHLVASHHGHARPFGPVSPDPDPPEIAGMLKDIPVRLPSLVRKSMPPPYRADSGVAERFWRLVRRHGWWGLAYLEAVLRLGDWYASSQEEKTGD